MVGVLVPFATGQSTGLPEEPTADRAWLMCPGTPRAHIMIGPTPYGLSEELGWRSCAPAGDDARSDAELIAEVRPPLPKQLEDGATVVVMDDDGNRRVLRQGTNALECRPDGPVRGCQASCTDGGLLRGDVPTALVHYRRLKGRVSPKTKFWRRSRPGFRPAP